MVYEASFKQITVIIFCKINNPHNCDDLAFSFERIVMCSQSTRSFGRPCGYSGETEPLVNDGKLEPRVSMVIMNGEMDDSSDGRASVTLDANLIDVNASGVLTYHNNENILCIPNHI